MVTLEAALSAEGSQVFAKRVALFFPLLDMDMTAIELLLGFFGASVSTI
jgi:hypothetical protein